MSEDGKEVGGERGKGRGEGAEERAVVCEERWRAVRGGGKCEDSWIY